MKDFINLNHQVMVERYSFGPVHERGNQQMKCPVCRQKSRHADIAYVNTRKSREQREDLHSVKVGHGLTICMLLMDIPKLQMLLKMLISQ